jgi:hypothetical protein
MDCFTDSVSFHDQCPIHSRDYLIGYKKLKPPETKEFREVSKKPMVGFEPTTARLRIELGHFLKLSHISGLGV